MLIAMMSDIHSNREAFEACLHDARSRGAERLFFLGDFVGYGADPVWVVDTAMELVAGGAVAIQGNHDNAVSDFREELNAEAEVAITWTRGQLGPEARQFLAGLPMRFEEDLRLFVHADVQNGRRWHYIDSPEAADRALESCSAQAVFCGHLHRPALYGITATGRITSFRPVSGVAIPLPRHRRWLAVLGSVGQPRDGSPAASYVMLDTGKNDITYHRVPYDVDGAATKIRLAGLPYKLAERLGKGR
ncbi:MAG: metallophosphoesterase family protein [Deltaproteobacteria bacterium]|nr:metallophosphoesterase family protein [Deltaproteobacteria bacterium]